MSTYQSEVTQDSRRQCCRNAGENIKCSKSVDFPKCRRGDAILPDYGNIPPMFTNSATGAEANVYCAPEHCWTSGQSDACDDTMALVALRPKHADSTCQPLPYNVVRPGEGKACIARNEVPSTCSNMTATATNPSTGSTVFEWLLGAKQSPSETRRAWADYTALEYANAHPEDDTTACLNAPLSNYKDPCLGATYRQLIQRMGQAFGAAAVAASGVVSRKACWWMPCSPINAGRFLQTSAIVEQSNACPSINACLATVSNMSIGNENDVVCIVQNCSTGSCKTAVDTVLAAAKARGSVPPLTGTECGGCNAAIAEALVGTGYSLPTAAVVPDPPSAQKTRDTAVIAVGAVAGAIVLALIIWAVYTHRRRPKTKRRLMRP